MDDPVGPRAHSIKEFVKRYRARSNARSMKIEICVMSLVKWDSDVMALSDRLELQGQKSNAFVRASSMRGVFLRPNDSVSWVASSGAGCGRA